VNPSRWHGDRGSGFVAGITIMFALTFLGLVWLARDVDRAVSNRTAAQSIAFQAARAAAQESSVADLRTGGVPRVDPPAARSAAARTARDLLAGYGLSGTVRRVDVDGDAVTVVVAITDRDRTVTGNSTVRAERAP
jgi:Tfp pilus assembly protein PilX